MARQARVLSNTGIYHIMLRGNERKNIFRDSADKLKFLEGLIKKHKEIAFLVYAYCLMNNHVHLLLNTNNNDLASIMRGIAVRYATFYNWKYQRVGHVFQDRFKSEAVEDELYLLAVVRYIHNNPVKAGIVSKPSDYKWSSFGKYITPVDDAWFDATFVLGLFEDVREGKLREFQKFSMEPDQSTFLDDNEDEEKAIRTFYEGQAYLEQYLPRNMPEIPIDQIPANKQRRDDLIRHLRKETSLSQRMIAQLIGIDKGIVERVLKL